MHTDTDCIGYHAIFPLPERGNRTGPPSPTPLFHLCVYVSWFDLENMPRFLVVLRGGATLILCYIGRETERGKR